MKVSEDHVQTSQSRRRPLSSRNNLRQPSFQALLDTHYPPIVVITVIEYRRAPEKFHKLSARMSGYIKYCHFVDVDNILTWNVFTIIAMLRLLDHLALVVVYHSHHLGRPVGDVEGVVPRAATSLTS